MAPDNPKQPSLERSESVIVRLSLTSQGIKVKETAVTHISPTNQRVGQEKGKSPTYFINSGCEKACNPRQTALRQNSVFTEASLMFSFTPPCSGAYC